MKTTPRNEIDSEIEADLQAVLDRALTGKPLAQEVERRVQERAELIRQEVLAKHGVLDVAVDLIRKGRKEA